MTLIRSLEFLDFFCDAGNFRIENQTGYIDGEICVLGIKDTEGDVFGGFERQCLCVSEFCSSWEKCLGDVFGGIEGCIGDYVDGIGTVVFWSDIFHSELII